MTRPARVTQSNNASRAVSADQWNAVVDKLATTIDAQDYGAVGDGTTDDTTALNAAIQAAQSAGKPLRLGVAHKITSALTVDGDLEIIGQNTVLSTSAHNHAVFSFSGTRLKISKVVASGESKFVWIANNTTFDEIEIDRCTFTGVYSTASNYLVYASDESRTVVGGDITVSNCKLTYCTTAFLDEVRLDDLTIDNNRIAHTYTWVVRALDSAEPADPADVYGPDRIVFTRNKVLGINDDFPLKTGQVARLIQANARTEMVVEDNHVSDVIPSGGTASGIYWKYGSIHFNRNRVSNFQSDGATGERFISDKSSGLLADRYQHKIFNNVFDQTDVTSSTVSPSAMIHFYAAKNVSSGGNTFIGLRCPAYRFYQSVDAGLVGGNHVIGTGDHVINHYYPAVVVLFQQMKNVVVDGITVHQISNPETLTAEGGETRLRLVTLYQNYSNGLHLENVTVRNCVMQDGDSNTVLAFIYRNASAATSEVKDWSLHGNRMKIGAGYARFTGAVGSGSITGNSSASATLAVGTIPTGTVIENNSPAPTGTTSWTPGSIAAGATATRTATVTGASIGDMVSVSAAGAQTAGLRMSAEITANNTATLSLYNPTAGALTGYAGTYYLRCARRSPA